MTDLTKLLLEILDKIPICFNENKRMLIKTELIVSGEEVKLGELINRDLKKISTNELKNTCDKTYSDMINW